MDTKKLHHSDSLLIGAILFFIGGFQNVYTYIECNGIFANLQTGNMTLLVVNLAQGNINTVPRYLIPILSFCLGVFVGTIVDIKKIDNQKIHWRTFILAFQLITVIIVGLIPDEYDLISASIITFNAALTLEGFRKVNNRSLPTTMMIGNLRKIVEHFTRFVFLKEKDEERESLLILFLLVVFLLGCIAAAYLSNIFTTKAIWFLIPIYIIAIIYLQNDSISN